MDSKSRENSDTKAEFRKPLNDAANRKYRKRSPLGGASSSSDGSPSRERNNSPAPSRKNIAKIAHNKQKRDDGRDYFSGRGGESYKYSDRHSSRNYDKFDDYRKHDRHVDDYDRGNSKSFGSSRGSRDLSYSRGGKEPRYKDYPNDVDKYPREKSDASVNRSKDKNTSDRRHGNVEERDRSGRHLKEASQGDGSKELEHVKYSNEDKKRYDDRDWHSRKSEKHSDVVSSFSSKDKHSDSKKPKVSSWDNTGTSEKACATDSDIDAAKVAAMKAAELVNKNLVGTGVMSTDQKKKLLWGNKKSTTTEEPAHRWNSAIFGDRERQEKFNKLMGVKGEPKVDQKQDDLNAEKQREQLQLELEKQYTAGLRRKDGRTVGLGL